AARPGDRAAIDDGELSHDRAKSPVVGRYGANRAGRGPAGLRARRAGHGPDRDRGGRRLFLPRPATRCDGAPAGGMSMSDSWRVRASVRRARGPGMMRRLPHWRLVAAAAGVVMAGAALAARGTANAGSRPG